MSIAQFYVQLPGQSGIAGINLEVDGFVCSSCNERWCNHMEHAFNEYSETKFITPGRTYSVPILPSENIWTQIVIGDPIVGNSALMKMHYHPEIGRKLIIDLGFWNPGEGMLSMRAVVIDWVRSMIDPKDSIAGKAPILHTRCPQRTHGVRETRIMEQVSRRFGPA